MTPDSGRPAMTLEWIIGTAAVVSAFLLAVFTWVAVYALSERRKQRRRARFRAIDDRGIRHRGRLRLVESKVDSGRYIFVPPGLVENLESLAGVPGTLVRSRELPTAPVQAHDLAQLFELVQAAENRDLLPAAS